MCKDTGLVRRLGWDSKLGLACTLVRSPGLLLLDEPTASLDAANRDTVLRLMKMARDAGTAMVGIFHDEVARDAVATRYFDVTPYRRAA